MRMFCLKNVVTYVSAAFVVASVFACSGKSGEENPVVSEDPSENTENALQDSLDKQDSLYSGIHAGKEESSSSGDEMPGSSSGENDDHSVLTPYSSSYELHPIDYYLNPDIIYGEFTDERDGHVYKTVEIEGQTWMAQNLNYKTPDGKSTCFNDNEEICEVFGREYPWTTAIDSAGINFGTNRPCRIEGDTVIQGVCPVGWHVPTQNEWMTLLTFAASDTLSGGNYVYLLDAPPKLLSKEMWPQGKSFTDEFGFSLLPNFNRYHVTYLLANGGESIFQSCSERIDVDGRAKGTIELNTFCFVETSGFLRCVKDGSAIRYPSPRGYADSCNIGGVDNCNYGILTDARDGKTYKTVKIGNQEWMAENLRYADSVKTPSLKNRTMCSDSLEANCEKYGRLYTWLAAIDSARYYTSEEYSDCNSRHICVLEAPHQGICPDGWRLPMQEDFEILSRATDADFYDDGGATLLANPDEWGERLLRPDSFALNVYGFNVLPTHWKENPKESSASTELWTGTVGTVGRYAILGSSSSPIVFIVFEQSNHGNYYLFWRILGNGNGREYKAIRCIKE